MKFNNIEELAKAVSVDILREMFISHKKYPINKELDLDIHKLPDDESGDMAREDPDEFVRLVNNYITNKLNYLYEEGFLDKKRGYYRMFSTKEINDQIKKLVEDND
jgi:hypothetical protein